MKNFFLILFCLAFFTSCSIIGKFDMEESRILAQKLLEYEHIQKSLSLEYKDTTKSYSHYLVSIYDLTGMFKVCCSTVLLDSNLLIDFYITNKFPITFNTGIYHRDIAIIGCEKSKEIVKLTLAIASYETFIYGNFHVKTFGFYKLHFRKKNNLEYDLIYESFTIPHIDERPSKCKHDYRY
jgi:hypothetical protein